MARTVSRAGVSSHRPLPVTSARMKAVRREGTDPELAVRSALAALGLQFRINVRSLPGTPDAANLRRMFAIFVHGCFWHRHPGCRYSTTPKTNVRFWKEKFAANVARDKRNIEALKRRGIRVVVVWQCELKNPRLRGRLRRLTQAPTR